MTSHPETAPLPVEPTRSPSSPAPHFGQLSRLPAGSVGPATRSSLGPGPAPPSPSPSPRGQIPEHLSSVPEPAGPCHLLAPPAFKPSSPGLSGCLSLRVPLPLAPQPLLAPPRRPSSSPSGPRLTTSISLRFHSRATLRAPQPSPGAPRIPVLGTPRLQPRQPDRPWPQVPPNSPRCSLSRRSPLWSESGCPDPPPSRRPSRRRSPGSSEPRRSGAPRAAGAEPGEGTRSGGESGGDCAQALLLPRSPRLGQLLLNQTGTASGGGAPLTGGGAPWRGRGQNRKRGGAPDASESLARKPRSACVRPKARR